MGRAPNSSTTGMYAKLVGLYPASYRRRYAQSMVQTFDDMLEAEPSKLGKASIWVRAFWDVPSSALKEHLINGGGINMSRSLKVLLISVAIILVLANGASFWVGTLRARQSVGIEKVTPTQLADAMQQDDFFSSYGDAALLFKATVLGVQQKGNVIVATFKTNHAYSLECQFPNSHLQVGESLSVAAPGGSAERLEKGVLLHNCSVND